MNIQWNIHHRRDQFSILEAAFFWLELEPSTEMLESPPYNVKSMKQVIENTLDDISRDIWKELIKQRMRFKYVVEERDINDYKPRLKELFGLKDTEIGNCMHFVKDVGDPNFVFRKDANGCENKDVDLFIHSIEPEDRHLEIFDFSKEEIKRREIIVDQASLWRKRRLQHERELPKTEMATSQSLRKVAEVLGQKPKFLFPEHRARIRHDKKIRDSIQQNEESSPKKLDGRKIKTYDSIASYLFSLIRSESKHKERYKQLEKTNQEDYLSLLKDLFIEAKLHPFNSTTTGKILKGVGLTFNTVKTVLREIDPDWNSASQQKCQ